MKENDLRYIHEVLCGKERPWRKDKDLPEEQYRTLYKNTPVIPIQLKENYLIEYKNYLLFSYKLKYYGRKIDNEIADYMNSTIRLIEKDGSEELTKFLMRQTQNNIFTHINDAHSSLNYCSVDIRSLNGDDAEFHSMKDEKEKCVILHYIISALMRCFLELQCNCSCVIDETDLLDLDSLSIKTTGKLPNDVFKIHPTNVKPENHKSKNIRTDCSFLYINNNNENRNNAFTDLHQVLIKHELISFDTSLKDIIALFSGKSTRVKIKWMKDKHILATALKILVNKIKIVTLYPETATIWQIVSNRFIDENGNEMPKLGSETARSKKSYIVEEIVRALKDYCQ